MTKIRSESVWIIRIWNLDIVWDLVLAERQGDWCFRGVINILLLSPILFMRDLIPRTRFDEAKKDASDFYRPR